MQSTEFDQLPSEYRHLLDLAKEHENLDIIPLKALGGGRTGAFLFLVSASTGDQRHVEHFVLKFDKINPRSGLTEIERHRRAEQQAPPAFARQSIARLAYEFQHEDAAALLYTIAGQSLQRFRTLDSNDRQNRLETLFAETTSRLLRDWNADAVFERALHPQEILKRWLGYRLAPDGRIANLLRDSFHVNPQVEGFLVGGEVVPNPLSYGLNADRWAGARSIDTIVGLQHGDLNIGNIMAMFGEDSDELEGYFLIDFALYKPDMPLLYDLCYLEMSYLIRELDRAKFAKWVALISQYGDRDLPNPKDVPVELAGACAVIQAGRSSFDRWVRETNPSLSDDLWGQFWLAAVAAGLNYSNKTLLPPEARLAALIYSAFHLKRFCRQFGIPMPSDVQLLYDPDKPGVGGGRPPTRSNGTPPKPRGNLPVPPTPFIGRERELEEIKDLVMRGDVRLVTLTGPGGTGKTRLSLEVARSLRPTFDNLVYMVELAAITDSESVLAAIARALGVRETAGRPVIDELKDTVRTATMLLVLDNFEQVTDAAPAIADLLADCTGLKVVVTSREPLHVRGEQIFPVPPLDLPKSVPDRPSAEQLSRYSCIQLFVDRARAVKPDFELNDDNIRAVSEVCIRLDGLPLAIELATARLRLFSPQALLERVGSRLQLLKGGARDLPARQQTLRGTIEWSYQLLDAGEQRLFEMLSGFVGCTIDSVEAVAGQLDRLLETGIDVLDGLGSLVDKSLIRQEARPDGEPRFVMLQTIREYAQERLAASPDFHADGRRAHATFYADFTRRQGERLKSGEQDAALLEMEIELENIQLAWAFWTEAGDIDKLHHLVDPLWILYDAKGWYHKMADLAADLLSVLAHSESSPERAEQEIMLQISLARSLLVVHGPTKEVEDAYSRALELCDSAGSVPQLFPVLRGLASYYTYVGDLERGLETGRQIMALAESKGDRRMAVSGSLVLGYSVALVEDLSAGLKILEEGMATYEVGPRYSGQYRLGIDPGLACTMTSALILWMLGYPDSAVRRAYEAIALADKLDHPFGSAYAFFHTSLVHLWLGDAELCHKWATHALEVTEAHDFPIWQALATCLRGAATAVSGRPEEGLDEFDRGLDLYVGLNTPPVFWPLLLHIRAGVYGAAGRPEEGLETLDEALGIIGERKGLILGTELYRLKGELFTAVHPDQPDEAERWFRLALDTARERKAKMLELRAATDLLRLAETRGDPAQARQDLSNAYSAMTEGFDTRDLQIARALLGEDQ